MPNRSRKWFLGALFPRKRPSTTIQNGNSFIAVEREPVPTIVINPNASEASYEPKQRSYWMLCNITSVRAWGTFCCRESHPLAHAIMTRGKLARNLFKKTSLPRKNYFKFSNDIYFAFLWWFKGINEKILLNKWISKYIHLPIANITFIFG